MANPVATLLGNTKTRTLVLIVLGILIFGVVIAVSQTDSKKTGPEAAAPSKTSSVPNQVKSTPGSDVTRKYQELQEKANTRGAQQAAEKGTTFIPTLTGNVQGLSDADFEKQLNSAYTELGGKCSQSAVDDYRKQGLSTTDIIMKLKDDGCSAAQIAALFSPDQIAAALLAQKSCNVTGCSADAVKKLKDQGTSDSSIVAALKSNGCSTKDIVGSMKANGMSAEQIATALKANGASIDEIAAAMKENGFDAVQIANALAKAGFDKNDIVAALTKAGFSAVDIARAISELNIAENKNSQTNAQLATQAAAARRLSAQQEAQQLAAYSQQRQGKIQELVTAMDAQRKTAMDVWTQIPQQLFTQGEWATVKAQKEAEAKQNGATSKSRTGTSTGTTGANGTDNQGIILKAGSILFAVLDTAVNSDEQGPVMATIVAGSLKGAKLMGSMQTNLTSETIGLSFTAINMPNEAHSMGINAVAIDPDTARTALASNVDHHYLYRWGSLFASSFVQGYASAVANSGTSSTTSSGAAGVTTTTVSPAQTGKQQLFSGIAEVGQKWSEVVGQNFNRPITVTIEQGTGIGVLITADLAYGTDPIYYTPPSTTTAAAAPGAAGAAGAAAPGAATAGAVPGALGSSTALSADQRQALWNILQNQPVTTQTAGSSAVTTTTTMGGAPP